MLKKEITFIYLDTVQKQVYEMIAEEAKKRGYKTSITDNKFEKCEIGWYCEHINHPQFSKFSVIMLHDIMQQYGNWPDIWLREPWNKYDIGFLPSKVWVDNWKLSSQYYYANPRKGVYLTGWPKADRLAEYKDESKRIMLAKKIGLDPLKRTILYAPAWENDHKQDEFVQSMLPLNVNILIKQAPWPDCYPEQLANIKEMYELHKDNPRVIQMDPKTSILDAIMVSDVLVSEESSTMSESVMLGKPAISVDNWLIPDTKPSRKPANDYDYVIKTTKEKLTECIAGVIADYDKYQRDARQYSESHFSNIGTCIPKMLDILDAVIAGQESPIESLKREKSTKLSLAQWIKHKDIALRREITTNDCVRYRLLKKLYKMYKKIRGKE